MGFIRKTFFGGAAQQAGQVQASGALEAQQLIKEQFGEVKQEFEEFKGLALPFIQGQDGGVQGAFELQQAQSGALGPEAQAAAFAQFQESPGTQFLREQGLRLVDTGAAATGGLGGGERLRELTKFSQGLALQDFGGQFNRLGQITGTGLGALGTLGGAFGALGGASGQAAAGQSQAAQAAAQAQAQGITGQAAGAASGIGGIAQIAGLAGLFSDRRLKTDIRKVGELESGLSWYVWEWNEAGQMAADQPCYGVIAQEVMELFPHAVSECHGYLQVNYGEIH